MKSPNDTDSSAGEQIQEQIAFTTTHFFPIGQLLLFTLLPLIVLVGPAAAQSGSVGSSFCETQLAQTIRNVFTLIQFGGPLLGGTLALAATVALPFVRRSDVIQELKTVRNQGLLWGVLVAPLGTEIVGFLLNNVVAGGASCGF